jgi:hypothetical protein
MESGDTFTPHLFSWPAELLDAAKPLEPIRPFIEQGINALIPGAAKIPSSESLILPPMSQDKQGFGPGLYRQLEGLTTKESLGTLPLIPESEAARAAFLLPAIAGTVKSGADLVTAQTPEARGEAGAGLVGQGLFAGLLARGGGKAKPPEARPMENLVPAVRTMDGQVVMGVPGVSHNEIITKHRLEPTEIDRRGFVDQVTRQWVDREQGPDAGRPVPGMHSESLPNFGERQKSKVMATPPGMTEAEARSLQGPEEPEADLPVWRKFDFRTEEGQRAVELRKTTSLLTDLGVEPGLPRGERSSEAKRSQGQGKVNYKAFNKLSLEELYNKWDQVKAQVEAMPEQLKQDMVRSHPDRGGDSEAFVDASLKRDAIPVIFKELQRRFDALGVETGFDRQAYRLERMRESERRIGGGGRDPQLEGPQAPLDENSDLHLWTREYEDTNRQIMEAHQRGDQAKFEKLSLRRSELQSMPEMDKYEKLFGSSSLDRGEGVEGNVQGRGPNEPVSESPLRSLGERDQVQFKALGLHEGEATGHDLVSRMADSPAFSDSERSFASYLRDNFEHVLRLAQVDPEARGMNDRAVYNPEGHKIGLGIGSGERLNPLSYRVLEEATHAAVFSQLEHPTTPKQVHARVELERLMGVAQKSLGEADVFRLSDMAQKAYGPPDKGLPYRFKDVHEFAAGLISDPQLREFLSHVKDEAGNVFEKAWQYIKDLLGIEAKSVYDKAFDQVTQIGSEGVEGWKAAREVVEREPLDTEGMRGAAVLQTLVGPEAPAPGTPGASGQPTPSKSLTERAKARLAKARGWSAPNHATASEELGNKLVQYASAQQAGPAIARWMATDVLGTRWKDPAFDRTMGRVVANKAVSMTTRLPRNVRRALMDHIAKVEAFTGKEYTGPDKPYSQIVQDMVKGTYEQNALKEYIQALEDSNLGLAGRGGATKTTAGGKPLTKVEIGKRSIWIRSDLAPELERAAGKKTAVEKGSLSLLGDALVEVQIQGPTDITYHGVNMIGVLATSPGSKSWFYDFIRNTTPVGFVDAFARMTYYGMKAMEPEYQKVWADISKIGAGRAEIEKKTLLQKGFEAVGVPEKVAKYMTPNSLSHMALTFFDRGGRLAAAKMYENLIARGIKVGDLDKREFINRMGQYNKRLMPFWDSLLRDAGLSSFVVAGKNMNRQAIRALIGSPGFRTANPEAWIKMRVQQLTSLALLMYVIPGVINLKTTGSWGGRPGTRVGEIDWGKNAKDGRPLKFDLLKLFLLRRGRRITGMDALSRGQEQGLGKGQQVHDVVKDIADGYLHPYAGPVVRFVETARTGRDFSAFPSEGYLVSRNPNSISENIWAAVVNANPTIGQIAKGHDEGTGEVMTPIWSLAGAAGFRKGRLPSWEERQKVVVAEKFPGKAWEGLNVGQKRQVQRELNQEQAAQGGQRSDLGKRAAAERSLWAGYEREDKLRGSLPKEQQTWIKQNGLQLRGFTGETTVGKVRLPTTPKEKEALAEAMAQSYTKWVGKAMQSQALKNARPDRKQEIFDEYLKAARGQVMARFKTARLPNFGGPTGSP